MILFRGGGCGVGFCPKLVEFPEIYFKISNKKIQFDFCFSFLHFFYIQKSLPQFSLYTLYPYPSRPQRWVVGWFAPFTHFPYDQGSHGKSGLAIEI